MLQGVGGDLVKEDAAGEKLRRFPRCSRRSSVKFLRPASGALHLKEYTGGAINYEVVYWVRDQELETYMEAHQRISLDILSKMREMEIPLTAITQPPI